MGIKSIHCKTLHFTIQNFFNCVNRIPLNYFSVCKIKLYLLFGVNKLGNKIKEEERNELVGKSIYIYIGTIGALKEAWKGL